MGFRTGSGADAWRGGWLDIWPVLLGRGLLLLSGGEVLLVKIEQIVCNGCGVVKGSVNHWYMVYISASHVAMWQIFAWDDLIDPKYADSVMHLCGQQCAHKMLDEFLQKATA